MTAVRHWCRGSHHQHVFFSAEHASALFKRPVAKERHSPRTPGTIMEHLGDTPPFGTGPNCQCRRRRGSKGADPLRLDPDTSHQWHHSQATALRLGAPNLRRACRFLPLLKHLRQHRTCSDSQCHSRPETGEGISTAGSIPHCAVKGKASYDVTPLIASATTDARASIQGAQSVPGLPMLHVERCSAALVLIFQVELVPL